MTSDASPPPVITPRDDRFAARLRGFGPIGLLAIGAVMFGNAVFAPLSAVFALIWVVASRTPWRGVGLSRPSNWAVTIAAGIVLGVTSKLVLKAIVMPLLGADPINHAYHFLVGEPSLIPRMLFVLVVGAGFGEELVFRGFLFERLGALFGSSRCATIAIVLLTSAWFGIVHYPDQGLAGAEQATIVGLLYGGIYAATRRLWPLVIAHAAFDLTAYAIIYWDLETRVAHSVLGG